MRMRDPSAVRPSAAQTALERFTNREESLAAFLRQVESTDTRRVLHFYGMGGAGKSSLLDRLAAACAERGLPCARFDLSRAGSPANAWREALAGLRGEFDDRHGVTFPRFDLCLGVLSAREGGAPPPMVDTNPALLDAFHLATALVSAPLDGIGGMIERSARKRPALEALLRKAGGTEDVLRLKNLPPGELPDELMRLFTLDLKEGLPHRPNQTCPAVLFLDGYESLVRASGQGAAVAERAMDGWVRLLAEYALSIGALLVLAGRDRLGWADDDQDWEDYLEQHLLAGLSNADARLFLSRCGIGNEPLQEAIISRCRAADGCHAYALALCADIVENVRRAGGDDPDPAEFSGGWDGKTARELGDRFLVSLGSHSLELWVKELARTPLLNEACALALDGGRNHNVGRSGWVRLLGYSFVTETPDGFHRIHSVMRDALTAGDGPPDDLDGWYERFWTEAGEASLAFYHAWRREPGPALEGWRRRHEDAMAARDIATARGLLTRWEHIAFSEAERARIGDELWASAQADIARCYLQTPVIATDPLLREAIRLYEAALTVFTEEGHPLHWASVANNLGLAHYGLPSGDRGDHLAVAIGCFEAALRVYDREEHPLDWAMTLNNLGIAWNDLPTGNIAENLVHAIRRYQASLEVYTRDDHPDEWGRAHNNMGNTYRILPVGDQAENLRTAIACFEAALQVRTRERNPLEWAATQNNLGVAYRGLPSEDTGGNLRRAIACYESALEVYTPEEYPVDWAMTQNNLGIAYGDLPDDGGGGSTQRAIACYRAALEVYTREQHPLDWARLQHNLGTAHRSLPTGKRAENLRNAIACYEAALRVRTREEYPLDWAATLSNLANAHADMPGGNRAANLLRAIEAYEATLSVYQAIGHETMVAIAEHNLDMIRKRLDKLPA